METERQLLLTDRRVSHLTWTVAKRLARRVWFAEGTVRRSLAGPYSGLAFELAPQMRNRMAVFYRAYESEVAALLPAVVVPGMVVYNCGAHVGTHALHIAKLLSGRGVVYAFEPWPANFELLTRNLAHNARLRTRIVALPTAVGSHDGRCRLSIGHTDGTHHITRPGEAPSVWAPITTVDTFYRKTGRAPGLLLIDVEGEELNVLRGAAEVLAHHRPQLVVEHHGKERLAAVQDLLQRAGYCVRPIGARHVHAQAT